MNGLKAEPGWREACTARLKFESLKSRPPTSARTCPLEGSMETTAPWRDAVWVLLAGAETAAALARTARVVLYWFRCSTPARAFFPDHSVACWRSMSRDTLDLSP